MEQSPAPIRAENLTKAFGMRTILRSVDFAASRGETVALIGTNGAGKTTLLRCLAFILRPDSGTVQWYGEQAGASSSTRSQIAMVSHESALYTHLTLRENLIFAARMHGLKRPGQQSDNWLKQAGLGSHAHRLPTQISQGMRQRLGVARALIHDPHILLLDEPFSSLDQYGVDWLCDILGDFRRRGRAICFATHDERIVERLSDRVVVVKAAQTHELGVENEPLLMMPQKLGRAA